LRERERAGRREGEREREKYRRGGGRSVSVYHTPVTVFSESSFLRPFPPPLPPPPPSLSAGSICKCTHRGVDSLEIRALYVRTFLRRIGALAELEIGSLPNACVYMFMYVHA